MKQSPTSSKDKDYAKMLELLQKEANEQYQVYRKLQDVTRIGYRSAYPPTRIPSPEHPLGQSYFFSPDEDE